MAAQTQNNAGSSERCPWSRVVKFKPHKQVGVPLRSFLFSRCSSGCCWMWHVTWLITSCFIAPFSTLNLDLAWAWTTFEQRPRSLLVAVCPRMLVRCCGYIRGRLDVWTLCCEVSLSQGFSECDCKLTFLWHSAWWMSVGLSAETSLLFTFTNLVNYTKTIFCESSFMRWASK